MAGLNKRTLYKHEGSWAQQTICMNKKNGFRQQGGLRKTSFYKHDYVRPEDFFNREQERMREQGRFQTTKFLQT